MMNIMMENAIGCMMKFMESCMTDLMIDYFLVYIMNFSCITSCFKRQWHEIFDTIFLLKTPAGPHMNGLKL